MENLREKGELREEVLIEERKWPEKERWEKIEEARFNKWYNRVKGKRVPRCLKKGWKKKRWQRVTRFRLRDGIRENKCWKKEEKRLRRICE